MNHYGLSFLDEIRKDSQYGEYFSFEEYQKLKNAQTQEEFESFLRATEHKETHVFSDPAMTYEDMKFTIQIRGVQADRFPADWVPSDPLGCFLLPIVAPIAILGSLLVAQIRLNRLNTKRARLRCLGDSACPKKK